LRAGRQALSGLAFLSASRSWRPEIGVTKPLVKIEGTHPIKAPRGLVWTLLIDPDILSRCVPGVEALEALGDNAYKIALKTGVGSIKGA